MRSSSLSFFLFVLFHLNRCHLQRNVRVEKLLGPLRVGLVKQMVFQDRQSEAVYTDKRPKTEIKIE